MSQFFFPCFLEGDILIYFDAAYLEKNLDIASYAPLQFIHVDSSFSRE